MNPEPIEIVRRGYDLVSTAYCPDDDRGDRAHYEIWLSELESLLGTDAQVLDLGCGCGLPVSRRLSQAHAVTGIDISEVQIARARELIPTATFLVADMTEERFPRASWDAVVLLYSLIHVPLEQQRPLLGRIADWLRPGGLLLLSAATDNWTGTENSWLGVDGATMYWSHADTNTYRDWIGECGIAVTNEWFQPEGTSGHPVFLGRKT